MKGDPQEVRVSGAQEVTRLSSVRNLLSVAALTGRCCVLNRGFKYCLSFALTRGLEMGFDPPKPNFCIHRMGTKVLQV